MFFGLLEPGLLVKTKGAGAAPKFQDFSGHSQKCQDFSRHNQIFQDSFRTQKCKTFSEHNTIFQNTKTVKFIFSIFPGSYVI